MFKNVAGQFVDVELILRVDGNDAIGLTPTVRIKKDGSAWGASAGAVKEGENGSYEYAPTQAETDCSHLVVKVTATGAITQLVNLYPIDVALFKADVSALATTVELDKVPKRDDGDSYRQLRDGAGTLVQQIRETITSTQQ